MGRSAILVYLVSAAVARPARANVFSDLGNAISSAVTSVACVIPIFSCNPTTDPGRNATPGGPAGPGNPLNPGGPAGPQQNPPSPPSAGGGPHGAETAGSATEFGKGGGGRGTTLAREPKVMPTGAALGDPRHTGVATIVTPTTVKTDWGECVAVVNRRADGKSVAIPHLTREEFDNFKTWARSNELGVYPCNCLRPLNLLEIHNGIRNLDARGSEPSQDLRGQPPEFGQEPDYYIDGPTINRLCQLLACGTATLLSQNRFASPDDNTIAAFFPDASAAGGGTWVKRSAQGLNRKLDHLRPTLYCAMP